MIYGGRVFDCEVTVSREFEGRTIYGEATFYTSSDELDEDEIIERLKGEDIQWRGDFEGEFPCPIYDKRTDEIEDYNFYKEW